MVLAASVVLFRAAVSAATAVEQDTGAGGSNFQAFDLEGTDPEGSTKRSTSTRLQSLLGSVRQYPPQVAFIFGNEACERFSFYGMRSILVIYLTQHLLFADHVAESIFHTFAAGCYLMPLAGAYISDHFLGKLYTIAYLSCVYCLGHLILALWESTTGTFVGLAAIAVGSGGIKPCVSAFIGDQFPPEKQSLLQGAFAIFYACINLGSFMGNLVIPLLMAHEGPRWAFAVPGIAMGVATAVLLLGSRMYVNLPPVGRSSKPGAWSIVLYCISRWRPHWLHRHPDPASSGQARGFWDAARERFSAADVNQVIALANVLKVFSALSIFWALFDQNSSSWVLQARDMDRHVGGLTLAPTQLQVLNPLFVMIFIPITQYVLYPLARRYLGVEMTPLRSMSIGMFSTALAFFIVFCIQVALDAGHKVSVLWQVPAYIVLTLSELLVSVRSLEFAYAQAPPTMKATVMSLLMLAIFVGNAMDAVINAVNVLSGALYFLFFTVLMLVVAVGFIWIAASFRTQASAIEEAVGLVSAGAKQRSSDDEASEHDHQTAHAGGPAHA